MLKSRIEKLESKSIENSMHIIFFDSKANKEDCIRHKLPFDVTISEVLRSRPSIEVIHFDEMGELIPHEELQKIEENRC